MSEALDLVIDRDPLQRELAETRKRLAELKRRAKAESQAAKCAGKTRATIENPEARWRHQQRGDAMPEALDLVIDRDPLQPELAETRKRLAELKRRVNAEKQAAKRAGKTRSTIENPEASDWVWGAKSIGRIVNRSESQVHYLFSKNYFGDAVWKFSHKHLVGSRTKLTALAGKPASET